MEASRMALCYVAGILTALVAVLVFHALSRPSGF